jgi:hypothetical protein
MVKVSDDCCRRRYIQDTEIEILRDKYYQQHTLQEIWK